MAAPSSPRLRPVSEFENDLEGFLEHVADFRNYTKMKEKMDSIRRAMHNRPITSAKTAPEPASINEPKLTSKQEPESKLQLEPEPEPELEAEHKLEVEIETEPKLEPKMDPRAGPESEPASEHTSKPETSQDESFLVKRTDSLVPDLQFGSLEQDTILHCKDDSVTISSLLLVLLAPWLGDVLQAARAQEDSIRNILCPDLGAESLRRLLDEVGAMKDEIIVGEDIKSFFFINLTVTQKETSKNVSEDEIKNIQVDEDINETFVKLDTNSEETKPKIIRQKKISNYNANMLAKFDRVCKCKLNSPTDNQKIEHFKITHDIYEKCPNRKCKKSYIRLIDEIHVCKSRNRKTPPKPIAYYKPCTVCGKNTHKSEFHSTTPATCEGCGKTVKNMYTLKTHICRFEMPCPICGKVLTNTQMYKHTKQWHTPDSEKKWKCEHCGKGFLDKAPMVAHINVHLKIKPNKCKMGCGLGFADPRNRRQHEKRVHKNIPTITKDNISQ